MDIDIDRAKEMADMEAIDKLCDGPFELVEEGYNWRLDWPDLMGTDDNERLDELRVILGRGQYWFTRGIDGSDLGRSVAITERQISHSLDLMEWCLQNLRDNGVEINE